jgi:hypothetical protein
MKCQNPLRVILLVAAIIFSAPNPSHAEAPKSGNDFLSECSEEGAMIRRGIPMRTPFIDGYCLGVVRGLRFMAEATMRFRARIPQTVRDGQAVRVILNFLRNNPARTHELFERLILNAFQDAWPCKN